MSTSLAEHNEKVTNATLRKKLAKVIEEVNEFVANFREKHNNVATGLEEFKKLTFGTLSKVEAELMQINQALAGLDINVLALAKVSRRQFELMEIAGLVIERIGGENAILSEEDKLEVRLRSSKRYEGFVAEAFTEVHKEQREAFERIQAAKEQEEAAAAKAKQEAEELEAALQKEESGG